MLGQKIYNDLKSKGVKVCFDDRDYSIGEKLKDNELWGINKIIIIGNSYLNNELIEIEDRKLNEKLIVTLDNIINRF
jgi:prolyl-tRNA synthetase